jgi:hypothetical protein
MKFDFSPHKTQEALPMLSRFMKNWNPFFFTPHDARPIALFRICMGTLFTCMMLASAPNWNRFFHAQGIISLDSVDLNNTRVNDKLGLFYWTEGIVPIECYWYFGVAICTLFAVGLFTRVTTVGLWLLIRSMLQRNPYLANGEEMVCEMCLLYLMWVDLGAAYSLDAYFAKRKCQPKPNVVAGWPIRMMQLNVALIYGISLPYKFAQDPGWITGDALHWTVASDMWGPHEHPWITLAYGGIFRKLMTFGTVFVEAFFPLAVWFSMTRRPAIAMIAALHLGIAAMIPNVTYFTLSMVCCFPAFLVKEDIDGLEKCVSHTVAWLKNSLRYVCNVPDYSTTAASPTT